MNRMRRQSEMSVGGSISVSIVYMKKKCKDMFTNIVSINSNESVSCYMYHVLFKGMEADVINSIFYPTNTLVKINLEAM